MKNLIEKILGLPKWYGLCVVLIYAALLAEYMSEVNSIFLLQGLEISNVVKIFVRLSYVVAILSSFAVWVVVALLFHFAALLLDGSQKFSKFLMASSFMYIFPAVGIFIAIFLLDGVNVEEGTNVMEELVQNERFRIIQYIVNGSFLPYYVISACIIHYLYKINWIRSFMSVIIPVASIWGVTKLFTLL